MSRLRRPLLPKTQLINTAVIGRFRQFVGQPHFTVEIQEGDTVQMLIDWLGLPGDAPDLWVLVDHVPAERDRSPEGR